MHCAYVLCVYLDTCSEDVFGIIFTLRRPKLTVRGVVFFLYFFLYQRNVTCTTYYYIISDVTLALQYLQALFSKGLNLQGFVWGKREIVVLRYFGNKID